MYTTAQQAAEMVMERASQALGEGWELDVVRGERSTWVRLYADLYAVSTACVEAELERGVDGASWA